MPPLQNQEQRPTETELIKKPSPDVMKILMVVGLVAAAGFLVYKFMPRLISEVKPTK